jgi:hypothetical protein
VIVENGNPISPTNRLPLARDTYGNVYEYRVDGTTWNSALTVDIEGNVYGVMYVPPRTFRSGEIEFKLIDTPTLTVTGVTTEASTVFYGSSLSVESQRVDLQIRPNISITNEITEITNVQQTNIQNITNNYNTIIVAPEPPTPDPQVPLPPNPAVPPDPTYRPDTPSDGWHVHDSYSGYNETTVSDPNVTDHGYGITSESLGPPGPTDYGDGITGESLGAPDSPDSGSNPGESDPGSSPGDDAGGDGQGW